MNNGCPVTLTVNISTMILNKFPVNSVLLDKVYLIASTKLTLL